MLELRNLKQGEEVLLVIKRHWIVYCILGFYFLVAISFSLSIYIFFHFGALAHLINIVFWMMFLLFFYISWLDHELDMYVITSNRIIGVEQLAFLDRNVSECGIGQVQEVNSKTKGLLANLLNYGTLVIQTAGNKTTMTMDFCPDAIQGARKLLNIVDEHKK